MSRALIRSTVASGMPAYGTEDLGPRAADGSGIICVAIVGGAIVPAITGLVADASSLRTALIVPVLCYLVIAAFGIWCAKARRGQAAA